jgi:DNA-binding response OmpR family regulator
MGGQVRVAPDAMMALTFMHKQPPDIVLLDLHLPAGSGEAVMEMMRADTRLCRVPVVVYSGTTDNDSIDSVRAMGAHFVRKADDDWTHLQPIIQKLVLDGRRSRNTAAASPSRRRSA